MIGLLRAEFIKLFKRRLPWVMTFILGGLMGVTALVLMVLPGFIDDGLDGFTGVGRPEAFMVGFQQAVSQTWFPLILAVVFLGGEMTGTAWASTLTREARRWMHVLARLVVLTVASWAAMLLVVAMWSVMVVLFADGAGGPGLGEWLGAIWKLGLVQFVWAALGLGAIAWLRSTGPAIGLVVAFSFVESILGLWSGYQPFSLTGNSAVLFGSDLMGELGAVFGAISGSSFGAALAAVVGWGVIGSFAAWAGLSLRDP